MFCLSVHDYHTYICYEDLGNLRLTSSVAPSSLILENPHQVVDSFYLPVANFLTFNFNMANTLI